MPRASLVLLTFLLTAQASPHEAGQTLDGQSLLQQGRYLAARDASARAAFDPAGRVRDGDAYQNWRQYAPMVTNELPLDGLRRGSDVAMPDRQAAVLVRGADARDALTEIVARARHTRVVIVNEAHYSPRDRVFALQVARALRPLGYSYLAVETISNNPPGAPRAEAQLLRDGFVRRNTGTYTQDPVFAAYLREAVCLGYRPIAYEITPAQREKGADAATREEAQASNLMAAVFDRDPTAKVLIHVGHGHVVETPLPRPDGTMARMAARLKAKTGIDPLTIDQTGLTDLAPTMRLAYPIAAAKVGPADGILFRHGAPLVLGPFAGGVDVQVLHPARAYRDGRPVWLRALGGQPVAIPTALLPARGERLVQAFAADAPADAVPLDRVLVTAGRPAPKLLLPPGVRVRYAVQP